AAKRSRECEGCGERECDKWVIPHPSGSTPKDSRGYSVSPKLPRVLSFLRMAAAAAASARATITSRPDCATQALPPCCSISCIRRKRTTASKSSISDCWHPASHARRDGYTRGLNWWD